MAQGEETGEHPNRKVSKFRFDRDYGIDTGGEGPADDSFIDDLHKNAYGKGVYEEKRQRLYEMGLGMAFPRTFRASRGYG